MLNGYVIDDDAVSVTVLKKMCANSGLVNIVGSSQSGTQAIKDLNELTCDLIFLDIEMPEINGFDLLQSIPGNPDIIVVSSDSENAVKAFDVQVTDFLLKPFSKARFLTSLKKINQRRQQHSGAAKGKVANRYFFVKKADVYVKVNPDDIHYLEAASDYVEIHAASSQYLVNATLSHIQNLLPEKDFCKIHRSYIVNTHYVDSFGDNMIQIGEKLLPVSRSGKKELERYLPLL